MLGTAFPAARILLVEQPGGWGPGGLSESLFDTGVARRLVTELGRRGIRVLAIRRPGRHPDPARRSWALADCRPGRWSMHWGSFEADADLLELDPDAPAPGRRTAEPVYTVCAHGTHDMCCAIEGRPVAAALERSCPGRVWECSHVGGDRFAANVLVLPTGQLYGRVVDTDALVAATDAGRVLPDSLRGQVGMAPAAQAALVAAQRELGLLEVGAVQVLGSEPADGGVQLIRLQTPVGRFAVGVQQVSGERALLTCRGQRPGTPVSYTALWLRPQP